MQTIADLCYKQLNGLLPVLKIDCSDNICSSVLVSGSFDHPSTWKNDIFQNSKFFQIIIGVKGKRYYDDGDKVYTELIAYHYKLPKMRKVTGSPEKVVGKIKDWIVSINAKGLKDG